MDKFTARQRGVRDRSRRSRYPRNRFSVATTTIATYSSRGPTRSYWTDESGINHYDNLIKPEIAAPGNKTIFAQSPNNYLLQQNPSLDAGVSNSPTRKQMMLSGTSMAAPLVSGAAALMFEANPTLTPNLVKTLLMYWLNNCPTSTCSSRAPAN